MVDNFDTETVSDKLIAENVHENYFEELVEYLNTKYSGDRSPYYFKAVDDNKELYIFDPT